MNDATSGATPPPVDEHTANDWMAERLNDTGRREPIAPSTPLPAHRGGDHHRGQAEESKRGSHL